MKLKALDGEILQQVINICREIGPYTEGKTSHATTGKRLFRSNWTY